MRIKQNNNLIRGFTLIEVIVALAVGGVMISGMILGYVYASRRAEWSAYSLAAQSLAMQRLEQTRAAKWDTLSSPVVDQVVSANFPPLVEVLDVPVSGTNVVNATTYTTIRQISNNPPIRSIAVDCVWAFMDRGVFTNTIVTYRAPDQ